MDYDEVFEMIVDGVQDLIGDTIIKWGESHGYQSEEAFDKFVASDANDALKEALEQARRDRD